MPVITVTMLVGISSCSVTPRQIHARTKIGELKNALDWCFGKGIFVKPRQRDLQQRTDDDDQTISTSLSSASWQTATGWRFGLNAGRSY